MADLELKIVAGKDLADKLSGAASKARGVMRHELQRGQSKLNLAMRRNIRKTFRRHRGGLENIVSEPIDESGDTVSARVGSSLAYAEIQERGGEIHAKNVKNLTIPLEAFMTGRGYARGTARDVIGSPGEYGYDGTFFSKGVLFGKRGKGEDAEVEPLFSLRPSVTLPARPYAQPAIDEVAPEIEASMHSALEALL